MFLSCASLARFAGSRINLPRPQKQESRPGRTRAFIAPAEGCLIPHASTTRASNTTFLRRPLRNHGFGGDEKPRDRRCILQRGPDNLGGVNDALADEVMILAFLRVEAV